MVTIATGALLLLTIGGYLAYSYLNKGRLSASVNAALGLGPGEGVAVSVTGLHRGRVPGKPDVATNENVTILITVADRLVISDGSKPILAAMVSDVTRFARGGVVYNDADGHIAGTRRAHQLPGADGAFADAYALELALRSGQVVELIMATSSGAALDRYFQAA